MGRPCTTLDLGGVVPARISPWPPPLSRPPPVFALLSLRPGAIEKAGEGSNPNSRTQQPVGDFPPLLQLIAIILVFLF